MPDGLAESPLLGVLMSAPGTPNEGFEDAEKTHEADLSFQPGLWYNQCDRSKCVSWGTEAKTGSDWPDL